jgi:glycosyltransferase involved in cell wall biosynthesis
MWEAAMTAPRVSIAMATYNGGAFLAEQLRSFADQRRPPDELVICDDGSTDDTIALARGFAATSSFRVRVEQNSERLGYSRNFEKAISLCSGDLICFSDQDDSWFEDKISAVEAEFGQHRGVMAVVNDQAIAERGLIDSGVTVFGNTNRLGFPISYLTAGCCTTIRRELLPILLPFPAEIAYDQWIGFMSDLLGVKRLLPVPLQIYRRHGANTTSPIFAEASPSVFGLLARFGLDDPRDGWRREIETLSRYAERIGSRADAAAALAGDGKVEEALARLDREKKWLETRLDLLSRPRLRRLWPLLALWRGGFYKDQFGLKSAIKDAIRP